MLPPRYNLHNESAPTPELPPERVEVETIIADNVGIRNETTLKRQGNLWFFPDMSMYVYYRPTHWRPLPPTKGGA